jgi:hypothetical protein
MCRTCINNSKQRRTVDKTNTSNQVVRLRFLLGIQSKNLSSRLLLLWLSTLGTNVTRFTTIVAHYLLAVAFESPMSNPPTLVAIHRRTFTIISKMPNSSTLKALHSFPTWLRTTTKIPLLSFVLSIRLTTIVSLLFYWLKLNHGGSRTLEMSFIQIGGLYNGFIQ